MIGRYYAMDRDKRWERIKIAIDGLVQGEGEKVEGGKEGLVKAIEENYKKDVTDEFLKPIIVNGDEGRIKGESLVGFLMLHQLNVMCISFNLDDDTIFCFNYRSDRMREIASVLGLPNKPMEVTIPKNLVSFIVNSSFIPLNTMQNITTMSTYNSEYPFAVAFPPQPMTNVLAEWLAKHDVRQAHVAGNVFHYYMRFILINDGVNLKKRKSMLM